MSHAYKTKPHCLSQITAMPIRLILDLLNFRTAMEIYTPHTHTHFDLCIHKLCLFARDSLGHWYTSNCSKQIQCTIPTCLPSIRLSVINKYIIAKGETQHLINSFASFGSFVFFDFESVIIKYIFASRVVGELDGQIRCYSLLILFFFCFG